MGNCDPKSSQSTVDREFRFDTIKLDKDAKMNSVINNKKYNWNYHSTFGLDKVENVASIKQKETAKVKLSNTVFVITDFSLFRVGQQ